MTLEYIERLAKEVYESLGKEHAECVYQRAMEVGLRLDGVKFESLKDAPVMFRGVQVGRGIADLVLEDAVIELKAISKLQGSEENEQIRNYMKSFKVNSGIIINFGQTSGKSVGELQFCRISQ